jgi:hypothetical protein
MKLIAVEHVRRGFRAGLVAALIALTFFSGRPTAGCVCADGHFKLVCHNHGGCCGAFHGSGERTERSHSCCCQKTDSKRQGNNGGCCHHRQCPQSPAARSAGEKGCCHRLNLDPTVFPVKVKTPTLDVAFAVLSSQDDWTHTPLIAVESVRWTWLEPGPPRSLFITLRRLLI